MNIDRFFYENPVFQHEQFVTWKNTFTTSKRTSINSALHYYVKTGRIMLVRRGLYAVIPPNQSPSNTMIDPYLIAGKATTDAVIAYHSALELMGMAYSSFAQLTYTTNQKSKPFTFQDQWFQPVATPNQLQKKHLSFTHTDAINRNGVPLTITSPARTYVDTLDRIELCGGWEEVCRSIHQFAILDVDDVIAYCLLLDKARLNATVGYFLSQRKGAFAVNEDKLKPLLQASPKTPQYASKKTTEPFQLIKPWNILLPISVTQQSWEEPDDHH